MGRKVEAQWSLANEIFFFQETRLQHNKYITSNTALEGQKNYSYEMQIIYLTLKGVFQ